MPQFYTIVIDTTVIDTNDIDIRLMLSSLITCLVGGFNPSEKYKRQLGLLFPIYGK
jgi:hypothetical protein